MRAAALLSMPYVQCLKCEIQLSGMLFPKAAKFGGSSSGMMYLLG